MKKSKSKKMEVEKMEVEGVTYSLLLRVQNGHIPSPELSLYKQTLSNAAKSKGQRYADEEEFISEL